jgi:hypothetical protein
VLAYVFWHWRRPEVEAGHYKAAQRRFHEALAAVPPPGFRRSWCLEISGAGWAANGGEAYEDWYLLDDSAAIDPLNAAAVSASRQAPHDAAAALAADGTAGLYSLRLGAADGPPQAASWLAKPAGMSYPDLFAALAPIVRDEEAALWGRQMTLGPALEFCVHAAGPVALPPPLMATPIRCRRVWPR